MQRVGTNWGLMLSLIRMTVLLDEAVSRLRSLPLERQDDLGEIILALVVDDESEFRLDEKQENEVRRRLSNPEPAISIDSAQTFFEPLI